MNMQAMIQQAQKLQKDIMKEKQKIDESIFISKQSMVEIEMKGTKEISKISITADTLDKDDIEILEDMIMLAVNENVSKINKETEAKLGKFGGAAGLL